MTSPDMHLYTATSGSLGWGAFWSGRWLQASWSLNHLGKPIVWKELFAIVNAVNTWGYLWAKQKILFHCDNLDIWHRRSTPDSETMALVRFCAVCYDKIINVVITHISGIDNCIADSLSRFQLQYIVSENWLQKLTHCLIPSVHGLFTSLRQFTFLE